MNNERNLHGDNVMKNKGGRCDASDRQASAAAAAAAAAAAIAWDIARTVRVSRAASSSSHAHAADAAHTDEHARDSGEFMPCQPAKAKCASLRLVTDL